MTGPEEVVARPTAHYPPADITPSEFEIFVTSLFVAIDEGSGVANLRIQHHEVVQGVDGTTTSTRLSGTSWPAWHS